MWARSVEHAGVARSEGHDADGRKWRKGFIEGRLDGLVDEPSPGAPRKIRDADVERVVTQKLESKPPHATHWSTRSMAKASGLSQTAVSRIWRACALQPHRTEMFKLSTDSLFIDKLRDVVGLYMSPADNAIVLRLDEKGPMQALDRTQPLLPLEPGCPERHAHDSARHGATSLFAALNVATREIIGRCHCAKPSLGKGDDANLKPFSGTLRVKSPSGSA